LLLQIYKTLTGLIQGTNTLAFFATGLVTIKKVLSFWKSEEKDKNGNKTLSDKGKILKCSIIK
jgi:hypothetical protein